ncbi:hypothetical protein ABEX47_17690 [Paenibacillus ehimensis]|uniref:hypothetical protein n=1 Tax=Paenibacillus ehimensis TaxID=79264 RepID=UPI003D27A1B6
MALVSNEVKAQIAKELTLAIADKIRPTNNQNSEVINKSYLEELNKAFEMFYKTVDSLTERR